MKTNDNSEKILTFSYPEFERDVRALLGKPDGNITADDVAEIKKLDCSNYSFRKEDIPTLKEFRNLETLSVESCEEDISFISGFRKLKYLYLSNCGAGNEQDCSLFSDMKELESLIVSGGAYSSMDIVNTEALTGLTKLRDIIFHEFGSVDLKFLEKMPWLEEFTCAYPDAVRNIDSIGSLHNLQSLRLMLPETESISFLDNLPDNMELVLCINNVKEKYDTEKLIRFKRIDVYETSIGGEYIDELSK